MPGPSSVLRTAIVDLQPQVVSVLSEALARDKRFDVIATSSSESAVAELLSDGDLDLLLLSFDSSPVDVVEAVAEHVARGRKVVVYAEQSLDGQLVPALLRAGCSGVVTSQKPSARMTRAIMNVALTSYVPVKQLAAARANGVARSTPAA
jgi:DNA-binding NarL/FixJ family response regulator